MNKPNWALLAGVRFFLAFVVLGAHLNYLTPRSLFSETLNRFNSFGAVVAFLMVSGFSMAHSLRHGSDGFYMRRVHRIYPTYLFCVVLSLVPFMLWGGSIRTPTGWIDESPSLWQFLCLLFMGQGLLCGTPICIAPAWSLSVECILYAIAPKLRDLPLRWILLAAIVSAAYCSVVTTTFFAAQWLVPLVGLSWAWLSGWVIYHQRDREAVKIAACVVPLVVISMQPQSGGAWYFVPLLFTSLALLYSHRLALSPHLSVACLYAGELSYPLYMCHFPVIVLWVVATRSPSPYAAAAVAIAASAVIYHCVDKPLRQARSIEGKHRSSPAQSALA